MAKKSNVCSVPRCGRHVVPEKGDDYPQGCISRDLCSRCYGSRAYWRRREAEEPGAGQLRQERLKFFGDRLNWLYGSGTLRD